MSRAEYMRAYRARKKVPRTVLVDPDVVERATSWRVDGSPPPFNVGAELQRLRAEALWQAHEIEQLTQEVARLKRLLATRTEPMRTVRDPVRTAMVEFHPVPKIRKGK